MSAQGFPIVLAADRSLTAAFPLLFDGMLAASQTTTTPRFLLDGLLQPRPAGGGCPAPLAPLGLRRVEAALRRDGFAEDAVVVTTADGLDRAIGTATRVIGIATGEPLGRGMNSSTMAAVAGGRAWPEALFMELLADARRLRRRCPEARIVVGGPGAWQLAADEAARRRLGVDHVITGYCEESVAAVMRGLIGGADQAPVIEGVAPSAERIPPIVAPATFGAVELSRGCGWGCAFCAMAGTPMRHLAAPQVLADVDTNLAGGWRHAALLSEDLFRYGGRGAQPQPEALLALLAAMRERPGLGLLQPDHANLASLAMWSDAQLVELRRLLDGGRECPVWLNCGVETADGALLAANGGAPKLGGCRPEDWAAFSSAQLRRLAGAGFLPFASLVMGLPGENPDHVEAAIRWTDGLGDTAVAVFPMVLAPVAPPWDPPLLSKAHWRLMQAAYRRNFGLVARMYDDQHRAAGSPRLRRGAATLLGYGKIWQWSGLFAWHRWRARA